MASHGWAGVFEPRSSAESAARISSSTSARDAGVIRPVPRSTVHPSYGYTTPGRFITLTTCTPEYTSRYRLVVWGTLVSTQPR